MVARGTRPHVCGRSRSIRCSSRSQGTVAKYDIPKQPFADLIRAFIQDQTVTRYQNWDDVLDYCVYSANPVGRLVLYLCGYSDAERQRLPTPPAPACSSPTSGRTSPSIS